MSGDSSRPLPFIIVCTARCGAGMLTKWLCDAGVNATHERVFANHGEPFSHKRRAEVPDSDCEVSWCAAPWLMTSPLIRQSCVVHLMRNPWMTLQSLVTSVPLFGEPARDRMAQRCCNSMLIEKQYPLVYKHEDPYAQAAEYMLAWHAIMMDAYASRTIICHRIEDNPNGLFERMRNVQDSDKWRSLFPKVEIGTIEWSPRAEPECPWDVARQHLTGRLLYGLIRLAHRWGYECES